MYLNVAAEMVITCRLPSRKKYLTETMAVMGLVLL